MTKIGIVYYSAAGATATLAEQIGKGAKGVADCEVARLRIRPDDLIGGRFVNPQIFSELEACDAIIFGSPTYMGGVASQFKAFADATSDLWCEQLWANKLAAGFTCGSAPNGDQSETLHYLFTLACQQGMLWVSIDAAHGYTRTHLNRLGSQIGVIAHIDGNCVHEADSETARYLGERIAKLAERLK